MSFRRRFALAVCALLVALLFIATGKPHTSRPRSEAAWPRTTQSAGPLAQVRSWAYQLQNIDANTIAQSPYDLVVIDYAREGRGDNEFSRDVIERMKHKPNGGRRLVLAYLSIGEAEDYRYYWQAGWRDATGRPAWLGEENPSWNGNYLVRFWEGEWQSLIFDGADSYLNRIMNLGFDGVFLDRIDVYPQWEEERSDARDMMIDLVRKLSTKAKTQRPDFLVIAQNAEELLERRSYRIYIDGIVKEDLLFGNTASGEPNAVNDVEYSTSLLKLAQQKGKSVFVIEYLFTSEDERLARRKLDELQFVHYFGPRLLNRLGGGGGEETAQSKRHRTGEIEPGGGLSAWLRSRISGR